MPKHLRTALAAAAVAALTGGLLATTAGTASAEGARPVADFNGDGYRDLAVSTPFAYVNGNAYAGQVVVLYGTANGISGAKRTVLSQDNYGVPGTAEKGDIWGHDTAAADFNNDGYTDLAVGAPYETVSGDDNGGTVQIIWGSANGLSGGTTVKDPTPTGHDRFGYVLEAADFDGDGKADLTIGVMGENGGNGAVYALKSDGTKISTSGAVSIYTSTVGVSASGSPYFGVNFGG